MKKLLSLALVFIMIVSAVTLVSCGKKDSDEGKGGTNAPTVATTPYDGGFFSINIPNTLTLLSETGDENRNTRMYVNMQTGESLSVTSARTEVEEGAEYSFPTAKSLVDSYKGNGTYDVSDTNVETNGTNYMKFTCKITKIDNGTDFYVTVIIMTNGPDNNIRSGINISVTETDASRPLANALAPTMK